MGFFKFIYNVGDTRIFLLILMALFNLVSRQAAFYFTFVMSFSLLLNAVMKFVFQNGRPFMYSSRVFPFICELEFGNPADEAMNSVSLIFAGGLYYYEVLKY